MKRSLVIFACVVCTAASIPTFRPTDGDVANDLDKIDRISLTKCQVLWDGGSIGVFLRAGNKNAGALVVVNPTRRSEANQKVLLEYSHQGSQLDLPDLKIEPGSEIERAFSALISRSLIEKTADSNPQQHNFESLVRLIKNRNVGWGEVEKMFVVTDRSVFQRALRKKIRENAGLK